MLLLAKRADQAIMAGKNGMLQERNFRGFNNSSRGGYNNNNR